MFIIAFFGGTLSMKTSMRKAERLAYRSCKGRQTIFGKICRGMLRIIFACDIPSTVTLGKGVQLVHNGLGVVMHARTIVGNNVKIYQNVTLGGNGKIVDGKTLSGGPIIEDNCAVFCGACVLGPVRIGHDSYIGANAVVTKDVPPNSLVYRNPMVITERKYDIDFGE